VLVGTVRHLGEEERDQLTIEAMSTEAVTTSEIEGEFWIERRRVLPAQLGLAIEERRVRPGIRRNRSYLHGCLQTSMFIEFHNMYIDAILGQEDDCMATARGRSHKHFQLDPVKIKRAQRVLSADTETEAIDRALDMVIAEHERNRLTIEANDRFVKSGIDIKDVYGTLGK
jgi:Domain of unknown function (DUF4172)